MLGGSSYLIPVIKEAKKNGYYVITCDYLPDNDAHKYSDEYHNLSVVDKEAVLKFAQERKIDGIISYACDAGVVTAAYVAETMGLNFQCSYNSARILQDKGLFRKFLSDNNFNCPKAKSYNDIKQAIDDISSFNFPVIVKPVDSAGSKGVSRADDKYMLQCSIKKAIENSKSGYFIVEEFIEFKGYHSSADVFTIDGELAFCTYSDQLFDCESINPYAPTLIIWPSTMDKSDQEYLTSETQRLMKLLCMKTGIYNIETCVGSDGKPYIMEVSPRGGGCKIAEIQNLATGIDLIKAEVRNAVGDSIGEFNSYTFDGHWCEYVVHVTGEKKGRFKNLAISDKLINNIKLIDLNVNEGDVIESFSGGNKSLGDVFLRFDSREAIDLNILEQSNIKIEFK